ncbi:MAG: glutamate formimidoyltransferase [Mariniphaga sp.]|nr:glutamate formimidoyltransferase [Mariniphaga sp.]
MVRQIIECIPNFSEGRDMEVIRAITGAIESVEGILLLNVDIGRAANRTVVTFAGEPAGVVEAAFRGIKKAAEVINMSRHEGVHPRIGATDVCPLVPVAGITMGETAELARCLAERVGNRLAIPVYCYESAAFSTSRQSLAHCRAGQYEGLKEKITTAEGKPDFGPAAWSDRLARTGATVIGARHFLVAYNVNLDTTSVQIAHEIACDVRESGRFIREGGTPAGEILREKDGTPRRQPGSLKNVRAIGWFIEEYNLAQVSMNLTNLAVTPVHVAFEEVREKAGNRGVGVTGSELIGLIPLQALLHAGKYFLQKLNRSTSAPDGLIIEMAYKAMGMDDLYPFDPEKRIIEYLIGRSWKNDHG